MLSYVCVCVQFSPVEIQTPPHWNPPVLSPSTAFPPYSSHWAVIPARKCSWHVSTTLWFYFFKFRTSEIG